MTKESGRDSNDGIVRDVGGVLLGNGVAVYRLDDAMDEDNEGKDSADAQDSSLTALEMGDSPKVADLVKLAVGAHFIEIGRVRSILESLERAGRADYQIFAHLPTITNFSILDLIKRIGGKNFGDLMLEVFYGENRDEMTAIEGQSGFAGISTNRAYYVDTSVSLKMEELSFDLVDDIKDIIEKNFSGSDIQYFNPEHALFVRYILERVFNFPQILELVDKVYAELMKWDPNFNEGKYRLRGSMVYEDWLDTKVAGVSPSGRYVAKDAQGYIDALCKIYGDVPILKEKLANGDPNLWKFRLIFLLPYVEFLFHKQLSGLAGDRDSLEGEEKRVAGYARYHLEDDEQLGIQVAPEIDVKKHVVAVIDEDNVVSMDLNLNSLESQDLLIRVTVDDMDRVSIHYGFNTEKYEHPELGHDDEQDPLVKPAYLSKKQILAIAKIMRLKKSFYGFDVDGEFCLDKENRLIDVQTRIAPGFVDMDSDGNVDLRGYAKVAESVFGLGQKFAVRGKLLFLKEGLTGMDPVELEALVREYGDLSKYILILDKPLAGSLFGLQRLSFERQNNFAGVIDMSRGVALTHTPVQSGASNFLRENLPLMGMGENVSALKDLIVNPEKMFSTSDNFTDDLIMICDDGKTVRIYAKKDVARVLMPSFRVRRSDLFERSGDNG